MFILKYWKAIYIALPLLTLSSCSLFHIVAKTYREEKVNQESNHEKYDSSTNSKADFNGLFDGDFIAPFPNFELQNF